MVQRRLAWDFYIRQIADWVWQREPNNGWRRDFKKATPRRCPTGVASLRCPYPEESRDVTSWDLLKAFVH
ncbi:unnamed protein product [Boreogadus saida]